MEIQNEIKIKENRTYRINKTFLMQLSKKKKKSVPQKLNFPCFNKCINISKNAINRSIWMDVYEK